MGPTPASLPPVPRAADAFGGATAAGRHHGWAEIRGRAGTSMTSACGRAAPPVAATRRPTTRPPHIRRGPSATAEGGPIPRPWRPGFAALQRGRPAGSGNLSAPRLRAEAALSEALEIGGPSAPELHGRSTGDRAPAAWHQRLLARLSRLCGAAWVVLAMLCHFCHMRLWFPFSFPFSILSGLMLWASGKALRSRPRLLEAAVMASQGMPVSSPSSTFVQHMTAHHLSQVALLLAQVKRGAEAEGEELSTFDALAAAFAALHIDLPRAFRHWPPGALSAIVGAYALSSQAFGPVFRAAVTAAAERSAEFHVYDLCQVVGACSIDPSTGEMAVIQDAELAELLLPALADHAMERLEEYDALGLLPEIVLILSENDYNAVWLLPAIAEMIEETHPDFLASAEAAATTSDPPDLHRLQAGAAASFKVWAGLSKLGYDHGTSFMALLRARVMPLVQRIAVHEAGHALVLKHMAIGRTMAADGATEGMETEPHDATLPSSEMTWSAVIKHIQILNLNHPRSSPSNGSSLGQDANVQQPGVTVPQEDLLLTWRPPPIADGGLRQEQAEHPLVAFTPALAGPLRFLKAAGLVATMDEQRRRKINNCLGYAVVAAAGDMAEQAIYGSILQDGSQRLSLDKMPEHHDHNLIAAFVGEAMFHTFETLEPDEKKLREILQKIYRMLFMGVVDNSFQTVAAHAEQLRELAEQLVKQLRLTGEQMDELMACR